LKNRSEKMAERGKFLSILPGNSPTIAQESGRKSTVPPFLQPIPFKSDRLLESGHQTATQAAAQELIDLDLTLYASPIVIKSPQLA
jgi:hypothetical protein